MTTTLDRIDRITSERRFHDAQAAARRISFLHGQANLRFDDHDYLDHEPWIRPGFELLGRVQGRRVLDYGCGHGMAATVLARRGAHVTAMDLSPGYVTEAEARAAANGVSITARIADAESMPFDDESFDVVWGCAILHHLHIPTAAAELHRVMRPGGVAVFCEPWGGNPLIRFARRHLPYPGKHRTPDEEPLTNVQLQQLHVQFPALQWHGFQLFGMINRLGIKLPGVNRLDCALMKAMPAVQRWSRYVVVQVRRD
jgi:2-polyprenyl-3-methyl-5-hydroxy-6-metoxy-1,4-benzoquinol methylase